MVRRSVGVAVAVVMAACSEATDRSDDSFAVADSAGVEIVTNGAVGALGPLAAREVLRLGTFDSGGPEQFSEVYTVAMNAAGTVFVGNNATVSVRAFGADGSFLGEFGSRGEGPAELSMVNDLIVSGDTVAVVDWQRAGKVVLFDLDQGFIDSWIPRRSDDTWIMPLQPTPTGWLTGVSRPERRVRLGPGEADTAVAFVHLMEFGSTEIGPQVYATRGDVLYGLDEPAEGGRDWALFRPRTYRGYDEAGRLFVTDRQAYRVDIHDFDGLRRSVRRAYEARPISSRDVADLKAAALHVIDTISGFRDENDRRSQRINLGERIDRQASLPLPGVMTPLGNLLVSGDGSFWVHVRDTTAFTQKEANAMFGALGRVPPDPTQWDLFDREGGFLGTVTLPPRFRPEAVRGREVVGVWRDELDVEYVIGYRAEPVPGV